MRSADLSLLYTIPSKEQNASLDSETSIDTRLEQKPKAPYFISVTLVGIETVQRLPQPRKAF